MPDQGQLTKFAPFLLSFCENRSLISLLTPSGPGRQTRKTGEENNLAVGKSERRERRGESQREGERKVGRAFSRKVFLSVFVSSEEEKKKKRVISVFFTHFSDSTVFFFHSRPD